MVPGDSRGAHRVAEGGSRVAGEGARGDAVAKVAGVDVVAALTTLGGNCKVGSSGICMALVVA